MTRPSRLFAAAVAAVLALAAQAAAQTVPFLITGGGVAPTGLPLPGQAPREHTSTGTATHLGHYSGDGTVKTDTAVPTATGFVGQFGSGSPYVFTAANGDKLVTYYGRTDFGAAVPGAFELTVVGAADNGAPVVTAVFLAEFVVQPALSTGRFKGATGSWVMLAWTEPFVLGSSDPLDYSWNGSGWLKFAKK